MAVTVGVHLDETWFMKVTRNLKGTVTLTLSTDELDGIPTGTEITLFLTKDQILRLMEELQAALQILEGETGQTVVMR